MLPERRRYAAWVPNYKGAPSWAWLAYLFPFAVAIYVGAIAISKWSMAALIIPGQMIGHASRLSFPAIRKRVHRIRDLPQGHVPQHAVRFTLSRETTYAVEEGLASFVDGWLLIEAGGCAFSLRTKDVIVPPYETWLEFEGPAGRHRLSFLYKEKGFEDGWARWLEETSPTGDRTILPPVHPLPRNIVGHYVAAALLSMAALLFFPGVLPNGLPWLAALCLLLLTAIFTHERFVRIAHARLAKDKPPRPLGFWRVWLDNSNRDLREYFLESRRLRRRRRSIGSATRRGLIDKNGPDR